MIQIVVACDLCPGEATPRSTPRPTVKGARKQAREDGFVKQRGKDVCPVCQFNQWKKARVQKAGGK